MVKKMVMVNIHFQMGNTMKVILKMIYMKVKVYMNGQKKEENIKANFIVVILKEMVKLNIMMAPYIKENILEVLNKEKVLIHGIMDKLLLEIG